MGYCTSCGHELGVGRFCTNCGHPVTPGAGSDPPAPRHPLFADEAEPVQPVGHTEPTHHRAAPPPRAWGPWLAIAAALVVVLVLVLGALRLAGDDEPDRQASRPGGQPTAQPTREPAGDDLPSDDASAEPAGDVARTSSVTVPEEAPPNQDVAGNPTTYVGANLLDGVPETCWRMAGDGTSEEIVVTLPQESHLTEVGMVNGYAKVDDDAGVDWYHGNRRVLVAEWEFDDGTTLTQELGDTTEMQTVDVDVRTTTVVVRLVAVSEPGSGPSSRDYTAISDLTLVAG